jgi:hypothetical protein
MKKSLSMSVILTAIAAVGLGSAVQAAEQGTTTGMATFHAQGDIQEFAPDMVVWNGEFWGQSVTDAKAGPLHFGAWYCTGEQAFRDGETLYGDGFCTVTDRDGDTINLRWEVTRANPDTGGNDTRGTYYSGTGKYAGIEGYYTFECQPTVAGSHDFCTISGGEYTIP